MIATIAQIIGYLASLFLAISLFVTNDLKFRIVNSLGCFSFIIYGILIHQIPIIATNGILFLINMYYLLKIRQTREFFDILEFRKDFVIIARFFSFYEKDIKKYFPAFTLSQITDKEICFIVLRDLVIANIFIATLDEKGTATVKLNYTVPKYRDYKIGKFLFAKEKKYLLDKGAKEIFYDEVFNKQHEDFLIRTGFTCHISSGKPTFSKLL